MNPTVLSLLALAVSVGAAVFVIFQASKAGRICEQCKARGEPNAPNSENSIGAAIRCAEAAEVSARAAHESARLAAEGTRVSQRAYLSVESVGFLYQAPTANQGVHVRAVLKNSGNSPAVQVRISNTIEIRSSLDAEVLDYPEDREKGFDIAPSVRLPLEYKLSSALTHEQMNAIYDGRLNLYLWGRALYRDIFGSEHSTKWCYQYSRENVGSLVIVSAHSSLD